MDPNILTGGTIRWLHIIFGITWIGLLYYFNFVQTPAFAKQEATVRQNNFTTLVPRALLFFRWAAMATWLAGLALILFYGATRDGYYSSNSFYLISIGGLMGTIMLINVWAIIWPNQKRIIAATAATLKDGAPAHPDQAKWARRGFLASRTNTMLSIPMLFFMVAAPFLGPLVAR